MRLARVLAIAVAACGGCGGGADDAAPDGPVVTARACAAAPGGRQLVLSPFSGEIELVDGAVWFTDRSTVWRWALDGTPPAQVAPLPREFASGLQVSGDELFLDGWTAVWRWTMGGSAWESVPLPAAGLDLLSVEGLPGGGVLLNTSCQSGPADCTAGSPLLRLAPGATEFEQLSQSTGPVRGWTVDGGALYFQRSAGSTYETVRRDLITGAERVLYASDAWDDAHPPLAADGDVIYAAMGDSGPGTDQTPGAIEERSVTDGSLLRAWRFPRTPSKFLIDDTYVYWIDPGWADIAPMPRPPEAGSVHRLARSDGTDESIASIPGFSFNDVGLTADAAYFNFEGGLWCLRK